MPYPKAIEVNLSEAERTGLEQLVRRHNIGQQIALRARIILAAGQGQTSSAIAGNLKVSINTAQRWRNRLAKAQAISYDDLSLEDRLQDGYRPGAPSRITADQRCKIEALARERPENSERPISQWTAREIAGNVETILALELLSAAQGIDFRRKVLGPDAKMGHGTAPAYAMIRQQIAFIERDQVMYPHIETMRKLLANGRLTAHLQ